MPTLKDIAGKAGAALAPTPTLPFFAVALLFLLPEAAYLGVVSWKHEFRLLDPLVLITFGEKLLFDFALFFAVAAALLRLTRRAWPALLYALLYFGVLAADTLVYAFSSTLLELQHFALVEGYSLAGFATGATIGFAAGFVVFLALLFLALRRLAPRATWPSAARWGALAIALGLAAIPARAARVNKADERYDRVIMVFRNAQIEYAAQNPLAAFLNDVVLRAISEELYTVQGSATYREFMADYDFIAADHRVAADPAPYAAAIRELELPIGERRYRDLGLGEMRRVIVVFAESFSADLLACRNPELPFDVTPNLCSPRFAERTFWNMATSGSPTLQGMTTAFSSHPNYDLAKPTGYRQFLTELVKEHGYKTLFMRSASRFFADENLVFKKWGFDKIVAREDFYERPELRKYIYGWGLEDRILYDEVIAELDRRRDEKLFVAVLGTDMHPLHGQRWFKHLEYPPVPGDLERFKTARHFMKAVHRVDFDLARFADRLETAGLLGDDALLIIVADHSCPPNAVTMRIPGHTKETLGRIPFVVLGPKRLPPIEGGRLASQIDVAPTIAHLMGLRVPAGWWGESLFAEGKRNPAIGYANGMMRLEMADGSRRLYNLGKSGAVPERIRELFATVFVVP